MALSNAGATTEMARRMHPQGSLTLWRRAILMHAGYALTAPFNVGALTLTAKSMRHPGSSVPWPSDRAVPMGYASTVTSAAGPWPSR